MDARLKDVASCYVLHHTNSPFQQSILLWTIRSERSTGTTQVEFGASHVRSTIIKDDLRQSGSTQLPDYPDDMFRCP
eukprot:3543971-Amphidinium_carterae.4